MQIIDKIYIGGAFVKPRGDELFDLFNPATEQFPELPACFHYKWDMHLHLIYHNCVKKCAADKSSSGMACRQTY